MVYVTMFVQLFAVVHQMCSISWCSGKFKCTHKISYSLIGPLLIVVHNFKWFKSAIFQNTGIMATKVTDVPLYISVYGCINTNIYLCFNLILNPCCFPFLEAAPATVGLHQTESKPRRPAFCPADQIFINSVLFSCPVWKRCQREPP